MKLKAGDKVRVLDNKYMTEQWGGNFKKSIGLILTITEVHADCYILAHNKYMCNFIEECVTTPEIKSWRKELE